MANFRNSNFPDIPCPQALEPCFNKDDMCSGKIFHIRHLGKYVAKMESNSADYKECVLSTAYNNIINRKDLNCFLEGKDE
ncbi:hypothetical protein HN903_04035 [archaeon]|jgi:hypothetical protein|nr:hypothetical protein [archaeon]MBT7128899.1 hypothetical protein [archaeon]